MKRSASACFTLALLTSAGLSAFAQNTGFTWGIVVGADATLNAARAEVQRVQQKLGMPASLFRCNTWIRTVVLVTDRRQAYQLLAAAQEQIRPTSYMVDMRVWCPGRQQL
jgi:hypothetical protein